MTYQPWPETIDHFGDRYGRIGVDGEKGDRVMLYASIEEGGFLRIPLKDKKKVLEIEKRRKNGNV